MIHLGKHQNVVNELLVDLSIPIKGKGRVNKIFLHNGKIIDGNKNMHSDNYKLVEKIYQALRLKFVMIYFYSDDLSISYKKNKGYIKEIITCFDSQNQLKDTKNAKRLFKNYNLYFLLFLLFFIVLIYKYNS